jgi:hypothetical protein
MSLDTYQKFEMDGGLTFEFFPDRKEESNIEWSLGDKRGIVDKKGLWVLAFIIGDEDQRNNMIPIKTNEVRTFKKIQKIKMTRDMKAGSEIDVPFKFTVPIEELLKLKKSGVILPRD